MPHRVEYNPFILGFLESDGPVFIPLQEARRLYGRLPSVFQLVSAKESRQKKKVLNLELGKLILHQLADRETNLKGIVFDFFNHWHRDLSQEFGLNMTPFWNLTSPAGVMDVIRHNQPALAMGAALDLRSFLSERFIRKDIINSISDAALPEAAERILTRKMKHADAWRKEVYFRQALAAIRAGHLLNRITTVSGLMFEDPRETAARIFADEIAALLVAVNRYLPLIGIEKLILPGDSDIAFEFATRDYTYLELGKQTGDCTSDKSPFQTDRTIENIYWTVFPWILDRNYQILKVFFRGDFVLKAHLMPLFILHEKGGEMVLAVDAIETVRAFRDDMREQRHVGLLENKQTIFQAVIAEIVRIADRMGIQRVYAEKFSNTPWVRATFENYPLIFLQVEQIIKLDELEDVFYLARLLSKKCGMELPREIFMEVQMKNTSLVPQVTKKMKGVKAFAVLKGDSEAGIPLKRVFGI